MQKNTLIIAIILSSFISGLFGAYVLQMLHPAWESGNPASIHKTVTSVDIKDLESNITKNVEKASPSVVSIVIKKDLAIYRNDPFGFFGQQVGTVSKEVWGGSGFFITKDGKIITNKHVVSDPNAEYVVITNDGKEYEAKVLALDPLSDLAVIQIKGTENFTPLTFINDSSEVKIGQFVIAVGNALAEFQNSVSFGVISGKNRSVNASGESLSNLLQTDAAINPGNSGGPLINLNNEVIGINTAVSADAQWIGFAQPLTQKRINYILDSLTKYGEIKRPLVGVNYILLNQTNSNQLGLKVTEWAYVPEEKWSILAGSSAEKAWLQWGDTIVKVDGVKISQDTDLWTLLQSKIPGDTIQLDIIKKDGKKETLKLTLGSA